MRSGTRSQCKSRWTPGGYRPLCQLKLGYEFCYLYAALCPFNGHLIALLLPDMTKESFCVFADYFATQTKALYPHKPIVLIADQASTHQHALCTQRGFTLVHLPTASPELNPVERLFEELRKQLSNQVFENMEAVENHLCQILKQYFHHPQQIIQLCRYPYIRTA
jgi:transposase